MVGVIFHVASQFCSWVPCIDRCLVAHNSALRSDFDDLGLMISYLSGEDLRATLRDLD